MSSTERNRREFLKDAAKGAALAGLALGAVSSASAESAAYQGKPDDTAAAGDASGYWDPSLGPNQPAVWSRESGNSGKGGTPQADLVGIITPNRMHFTSSHRDLSPNIDAHKHRLLVHGMVDRPMIFTMEDLKTLPSVSRVHYVACAANGGGISLAGRKNPAQKVSQTHGSTACSEWTGVPLSVIFNMVGVQKGANWFVAEGSDAKMHSADLPMAKAMDESLPSNALLVYGQNGEPVSPGQGYPLRLLVPGFEGMRNVKWVRRIKVTDRPYFTYYENVAYHNLKPDGKARNFQYEMEPGGVITFPSGTQQLPRPGMYEIRGIAWSGGGSVHRVEVSVDNGNTWQDAKLQGPIHRIAHTAFRLPWKWDGQETVIMSRTTDDNGDIQPTLPQFTKLWGPITPDYWQDSNVWVQHFNAVTRWKIDREGNVRNATWDADNNV